MALDTYAEALEMLPYFYMPIRASHQIFTRSHSFIIAQVYRTTGYNGSLPKKA